MAKQYDNAASPAAAHVRRCHRMFTWRWLHGPSDEDELSARSVWSVAHIVDDESMQRQGRGDFITGAEPQRRVGRDDVTVVEEVKGVAKCDERKRQVGDFDPVFDETSDGLDDGDGPVARPFIPTAKRGIACFEHKVAVGAKDLANPGQRGVPRVVVHEDLRDVTGHRHRIDDEWRERCRVSEEPGDPVGVRPRSGDGERCLRGVDSDHSDTTSRQPASECAGATADVDDTPGGDLIEDVLVVVEVCAVTLDLVEDLCKPRVSEDLIRHVADDTTTATDTTHGGSSRTQWLLVGEPCESGRMDGFDPARSFGPDVAARYDQHERGDEGEAAAFLAELARGGPALEFAIGTGRIALSLAALGVPVDGIELSFAMVERLRLKPGGATLDVAIGDMSRLAIGRRYGLVYLVFNTIFNLLTADDQIRCFENAARHLDDGGCFVVETAVPSAWITPARPDYIHAERVGMNEIVFDVARYDPVSQLLEENHVRLATDGITMSPIVCRLITPGEMDLMARIAGLRLTERFADWRRQPFDAQSRAHVSVYRTG